MKKLMMTTVAALGFAALAQAGVLNSTGFEDYDGKAFAVNATDTGATEGHQYWTGDGSADFSQTVLKTYTEAGIAAPEENVPDAFTNAANTTFLSVDTGNAVMYRRAAANPTETINLSSAGPVFFDADVKFTASETAVVPSEGDKLLVWLKGDENSQTTNLVVTAGILDDRGVVTTNETFVTDAEVEADTWYRLTVKAGVDEKDCTYFNVYIDGKQVSATYKDGVIDSFPSLVESGSDSGKLIEAAGFQGTGALDNVVWTTTDPFPEEGTYTLAFTPDSGFSDNVYQVTVDGAEGDPAKGFETDGIGISKTTVTVVVKTPDVSGTVKPTTAAAGVTFSEVETTSKVIDDGEGGSYTDYTYTFTVTVAEPAVGANYAIALSFVPGGVIDEDIDLATQSKLSLDKDSIKEGEAAPTVTVMVGDDTLTVDTNYTVTTDYVAGTSKAGTYTITVTAVENSGYTGSNSITFTVTAEEVVPETGEAPADGSATVKAESEEAALAAVTVKVDDAVAAVLTTPELKAAFADTFFTKTVVDNKDGTYTVSVAVKEGAVEAKLDEVVAEALETAAAGEITKIPAGLCYKIESGNTVGLGTVTKGVSTGAKIEVEGLSAEAGFYKVSLDVAPIK